MRPLNARTRRNAFYSYLILFIITLIPICLTLYLYGRVDHAENDFLREKYRQKLQMSEAQYSEERIYSTLSEKAIGLEDQITRSQGLATSSPESGNIETKINDLNRTLNDLQTQNAGVTLNSTELLLLNVVKTQAQSISKLNEMYKVTYIKLNDEKEAVKDMKEKLTNAGIY